MSVHCANASYFNPLPRKEGDCKDAIFPSIFFNFNPLPRKEGDSKNYDSSTGCIDFNPLPRKEGDASESRLGRAEHQFQSTPS